MGNKIVLQVLGIQFESEIFFFRDDGFVEDIHSHARKVNGEFGDDPASYDKEVIVDGKLPLVGGLTRVRYVSKIPIPIISFYLHYESQLKETFVRGHEETHVLQNIGSLHLLQEKLNDLRLNINIESSSDEELISDIGGLYAVITNEENSSLIRSFLDKEKKITLLNFYLEFLKNLSAS